MNIIQLTSQILPSLPPRPTGPPLKPPKPFLLILNKSFIKNIIIHGYNDEMKLDTLIPGKCANEQPQHNI